MRKYLIIIIVLMLVIIFTSVITTKLVSKKYQNEIAIINAKYHQALRDKYQINREKEKYRHQYQKLIIKYQFYD